MSIGWRIFPCHSIVRGRCTCKDGTNCKSPGKHPRTARGVNDATTDIQVINYWKTTYPQCNWGVAGGRQSGLVIIDLDPRHGGFESFDEYEAARPHGPLPTTRQAISGGGGRHHFFSYPQDGEPVKNRVDWLPGVDIRSDGGYVILAPGTHISGGTYRWRDWSQAIVELPADVASDIRMSGAAASADARNLLADSSSILEGVPEGKRDDTLFRWACRLRRQHSSDGDGGRAIVTTLVLAAAEKSNFPKEQALAKVEQAFRQDHASDQPAWRGDSGDGDSKQAGGDDNDDDDGVHRLTDMGNRDRFVLKAGENVHYIPEVGWYEWSDTGWSAVREETMLRRAEVVPNVVRAEGLTVPDLKFRKKFAEWADRSEAANALGAVIRLTRGHPDIMRDMDDFDSVPTDLACANGIVDLRTGNLRAFTRDDLVTHNTGVVYDPDADMGWWLDFIQTTTQDLTDSGEQEELMKYLQLAAGYTATGLNTQECFFIISGKPASGKSTYMDALMTALGSYSSTTQSDTFMYRRGKDAAPNELARMAGQRIVNVAEIREGDFFNEALIKQVTGGDRLTARHLYQKAFEYTPQFKLWIATNHDPISYDSAMLRRIKRIKFNHVIPPQDRKPEMKMRVRDKDDGAQAVLRWIVEGAREFLNTGKLEEPLSITMSAHEYRDETDIFGRFMNTNCVTAPGKQVQFTTLFTHWAAWCKTMNENAGRAFTFKRKLADNGFKSGIEDRTGIEYIYGIELAAPSFNQLGQAPTDQPGGGMTWG